MSSSIPCDKPLIEGIDWSGISRMGQFGQGPILAFPSTSSMSALDVPKHWVVKQVSLLLVFGTTQGSVKVVTGITENWKNVLISVASCMVSTHFMFYDVLSAWNLMYD